MLLLRLSDIEEIDGGRRAVGEVSCGIGVAGCVTVPEDGTGDIGNGGLGILRNAIEEIEVWGPALISQREPTSLLEKCLAQHCTRTLQ